MYLVAPVLVPDVKAKNGTLPGQVIFANGKGALPVIAPKIFVTAQWHGFLIVSHCFNGGKRMVFTKAGILRFGKQMRKVLRLNGDPIHGQKLLQAPFGKEAKKWRDVWRNHGFRRMAMGKS